MNMEILRNGLRGLIISHDSTMCSWHLIVQLILSFTQQRYLDFVNYCKTRMDIYRVKLVFIFSRDSDLTTSVVRPYVCACVRPSVIKTP